MMHIMSSENRPSSRPGVIVLVGCLCGIVVALSQTLVIPLVPVLPRILHTTSVAAADWAITSTLLAAAVVTPIAGRLGDMFGKRLILVVSMGALVAGSLVSALSNSVAPMVIGRTLQGLAMGAIALGISILRDELPADRVGPGVAKMSSTMGVGGAIGMPLAAFIAEKTNWHTLFWALAVLGLVCAIAVLLLVPESPVRTPAPFDYVGTVGLSAGLVMVLLVITKGGDWGWGSGRSVGLLVGGVVVLLVWGAWELRARTPLVDLRVSAGRQVLFTNIASVAVGFAMYGMSLIPTQILMAPKLTGYGLGLTMVEAGLVVAPSGLFMYLFAAVGARVSATRGPRTSLALGIVVVGAGYLVALLARDNWWEISISMAVIGAGVGIAYAAMPALIMGAVPVTETAAANGLNSLMRALGTSLSSAVISVVLANQVMRLGPAVLPSDHGFSVVLLICLGAAVAAFLLTLLVPSAGRPSAAVVDAGAEPVGAASPS